MSRSTFDRIARVVGGATASKPAAARHFVELGASVAINHREQASQMDFSGNGGRDDVFAIAAMGRNVDRHSRRRPTVL
jgi:hypothetical protein